jgi:uncharacterized protein (UPF0276 family)
VTQVGIGWRQPHYGELLERRPDVGFVEVHSENFFGDGGAALAVLESGRQHYPVSLHGVGLALGSAVGLDPWHLERLQRLVQRIDPVRVSDHACFARAPLRSSQAPVHGSDLLPIAFTPASLDIMVAHVQQVQDTLRRPIAVENLSAYLRWADDALDEAQFFNQLARRSGCGVLLDLNNLVVNAINRGEDPVPSACRLVDAIDADRVAEIHLAGFSAQGALVIDDHGSRVHDPVWQVFRHAIQRLGPVPTLIEWDTDIPTLDVLLGEAGTGRSLMTEACAAGVALTTLRASERRCASSSCCARCGSVTARHR